MSIAALGPIAGEVCDLYRAFCREGERFEVARSRSKQLFDLLPPNLKETEAFFDKLGARWRYNFGEPLTFNPSGKELHGVHQFPEVRHLFRALNSMVRVLTGEELASFLDRLSVRSKHSNVLFEARPIFDLAVGTSACFEVPAEVGDKRIDWLLEPPHGIVILLEVKFRVFDILQHFGRMASSRRPETVEFEPGKPERLFQSTFEKFAPRDPAAQLQGAWIHTHIQVRRTELEAYFSDTVPRDQLHFAILSTWSRSAFLLTRPGIDRHRLVDLFGIEETEDFVTA